jgi:hypothetical protein
VSVASTESPASWANAGSAYIAIVHKEHAANLFIDQIVGPEALSALLIGNFFVKFGDRRRDVCAAHTISQYGWPAHLLSSPV